jgi:hypothetical protein
VDPRIAVAAVDFCKAEGKLDVFLERHARKKVEGSRAVKAG